MAKSFGGIILFCVLLAIGLAAADYITTDGLMIVLEIILKIGVIIIQVLVALSVLKAAIIWIARTFAKAFATYRDEKG
jgi:hypothetical protein